MIYNLWVTGGSISTGGPIECGTYIPEDSPKAFIPLIKAMYELNYNSRSPQKLKDVQKHLDNRYGAESYTDVFCGFPNYVHMAEESRYISCSLVAIDGIIIASTGLLERACGGIYIVFCPIYLFRNR
jgi:hypothetical protein